MTCWRVGLGDALVSVCAVHFVCAARFGVRRRFLIVIPDARCAIRNRFLLFWGSTNHRFRVRSAMKLQPAPE
jgi:hypothetical protein